MATADKLAEEQLKIHEGLVSSRKSKFDNDWQYISQYALPQDSTITTEKTEGVASYTQNIFDTTMVSAAQVFATGMFNWWTPPNQAWAEYQPPDDLSEEQEGADDAKKWLSEASDKVMKALQRSNFYMVKASADMGLAVFNTDLMLCDESSDSRDLFNFVHCRIGTYTIEEDYRGIVDTVRREVEMTYRQIKQFFKLPSDNIPEKLVAQTKSATGKGKKFKLLHCIFPREDSDRLPGRKDGANKPIASVWIATEFKETMRVSGYDESPILCRRFSKWGTDAVWGYGPSYLALPDGRQVNYVQQYLDALAELHAYPRVLTPSTLEGDVDLRAGGNTYFDPALGDSGVPREWATVGDYKLGMDMQERRRQAIRDAYFVDAFKLLNSQPLLAKEMTAFEISQRQAEQLQGVAPAFSRHVPEFNNPLMYRLFGIAFRAGKLGRPPESLMRDIGPNKRGLVKPEVMATSRFNDALRALKNRGTEETFKFVLPMAETKPEVWDVFDMDKTVREYARNAGMPADALRKETGKNSVAAVRQARAQAMQQQRAAQMAEQMSKAGKNLGGAPDWMQDQVKQGLQGAAA